MDLEKCHKKHWRRILEIRNLVRKSFINSSIISYETHTAFMEKNHESYIVAIRYGEVVGFAGVVDNDVRVAVDPKYQKRGIGKKLLNEIVSIFPNCEAKIDLQNKASLSLFESCGFSKKYFLLNKNAQSS
tara:strand:+ start:842 stop:1231 length:390 start_codon:yes stop_codon:yes gene_type:complete